MPTLLLIRHGQTDWNLEGRYTGQSDVPLNDTGRAQAGQLAAQLAPNPPDVIYSSDLARARETAELIAAHCDVPLYTDPRLREINQGLWEGMLFPDIKARFTEQWEHRRASPLSVAAPEGETVGQVRDRVLAALRDILHAHPTGRVALVAHGLALALVKATALGRPITDVWNLIPPNAQVEEIEVNPTQLDQRPMTKDQ